MALFSFPSLAVWSVLQATRAGRGPGNKTSYAHNAHQIPSCVGQWTTSILLRLMLILSHYYFNCQRTNLNLRGLGEISTLLHVDHQHWPGTAGDCGR